MKSKKPNLKGAALIWVTLASTIVAIVAAGLIGVAAYYYNSAKSDTLGMTQNYLNCKSGIAIVYSYLDEVQTKDANSPAWQVYDRTVNLDKGDSFVVEVSSDTDGTIVKVTVVKVSEFYVQLKAESGSNVEATTAESDGDEKAVEEDCTLIARIKKNFKSAKMCWTDLEYVD